MSGINIAIVGNCYGSLPVNTDAPAVSGTATVGSTLSSSTGTWTGAPAPAFTYQWQRGSTGISGATSSSYTVATVDVASTIRCVVTATNSLGAVSANSNNTSSVPVPPPSTIGQAYGGGYYAGKIAINGGGTATHYLIVAPKSTGQSNLKWKNTASATSGTDSIINGPSNSSTMNNSTHPAAQFCEGLTIGGYSDWYLPAQKELEVVYYFLKPTTGSNHEPSLNGLNAYAVSPELINTAYTTTRPSQTSSSTFRGSAEKFSTSGYWCSTQRTGVDSQSMALNFNNGSFGGSAKYNLRLLRAVRRVAV